MNFILLLFILISLIFKNHFPINNLFIIHYLLLINSKNLLFLFYILLNSIFYMEIFKLAYHHLFLIDIINYFIYQIIFMLY